MLGHWLLIQFERSIKGFMRESVGRVELPGNTLVPFPEPNDTRGSQDKSSSKHTLISLCVCGCAMRNTRVCSPAAGPWDLHGHPACSCFSSVSLPKKACRGSHSNLFQGAASDILAHDLNCTLTGTVIFGCF